LRDFLALMLVGLVVLLVTQKQLRAAYERLQTRMWRSFGFGLATLLLAVPAVLTLILVSVLIVALAHLLTLGGLTPMLTALVVSVNLGVISGAVFVAAYLARLVIAYALGQWLHARLIHNPDRASSLVISLLLGTLVYTAFTDLPVVGTILNVIAICGGVGAISLPLWDRLLRSQLVSGVVSDARQILRRPRRGSALPAQPGAHDYGTGQRAVLLTDDEHATAAHQ
jgi:hypothetical protein